MARPSPLVRMMGPPATPSTVVKAEENYHLDNQETDKDHGEKQPLNTPPQPTTLQSSPLTPQTAVRGADRQLEQNAADEAPIQTFAPPSQTATTKDPSPPKRRRISGGAAIPDKPKAGIAPSEMPSTILTTGSGALPASEEAKIPAAGHPSLTSALPPKTPIGAAWEAAMQASQARIASTPSQRLVPSAVAPLSVKKIALMFDGRSPAISHAPELNKHVHPSRLAEASRNIVV